MVKKATYAAAIATLILPFTAKAFEVGVAIPGKGSTFGSMMEYVGAIFSFALKAGIVLTTLMFVYAGYKYITSQGNPTAINEAKDIIVGSLSGLVLLILVYLLLNFLNLPKP